MFFQVLSIVYASLGALIFAVVRFENGWIHLQSIPVNLDTEEGGGGGGGCGGGIESVRISGVFV